MKAFVLNCDRAGYAPDQIRSTLTVGELIGLLSELDEDAPIYTAQDNGYTYGGISWDSIDEYPDETEEEEDE